MTVSWVSLETPSAAACELGACVSTVTSTWLEAAEVLVASSVAVAV